MSKFTKSVFTPKFKYITFCDDKSCVTRVINHFRYNGSDFYSTRTENFVISKELFAGSNTHGLHVYEIIPMGAEKGFCDVITKDDHNSTFDWMKRALNESLQTIEELREQNIRYETQVGDLNLEIQNLAELLRLKESDK